jgi:acyl-CoA thioesterase YciA
MDELPPIETITLRLVLPRDANHHGTLYAGSLLALALEAGYSAAFNAVGKEANLVLKRVLDLRCDVPVHVGSVVEIRGREVHRARAQVVIALHGTPLTHTDRPWMDGLMQFVQVDQNGRPTPLTGDFPKMAGLSVPLNSPAPWERLRARALRILAIRR